MFRQVNSDSFTIPHIPQFTDLLLYTDDFSLVVYSLNTQTPCTAKGPSLYSELSKMWIHFVHEFSSVYFILYSPPISLYYTSILL